VYEADNSDTVSFLALFINWHNNILLPLIRKFFLIPNICNEFTTMQRKKRKKGSEKVRYEYPKKGPCF
jgi:hypothetical protein